MEISEERHGDVVAYTIMDVPWGRTLGIHDLVREQLSAGQRKIVIELGALATLHEPGLGEIVGAAALVVREVGPVAIVRPPLGSRARNRWDLALGTEFGDDGSKFRAFDTLDEALEFLARDIHGPPTDGTA